jgi:hypothetical protein
MGTVWDLLGKKGQVRPGDTVAFTGTGHAARPLVHKWWPSGSWGRGPDGGGPPRAGLSRSRLVGVRRKMEGAARPAGNREFTLLPRLDSNQQPFGEPPCTDAGRPQPTDLDLWPTWTDLGRHEPIGFSDGKVTVDLVRASGSPVLARRARRYFDAFLYLAGLAAAIAAGTFGRWMTLIDPPLGWAFLICCLILIGCGAWAWSLHGIRSRSGDE